MHGDEALLTGITRENEFARPSAFCICPARINWPRYPDLVKCFWDGSCGQSESGDEWITLAGIAAPDAVWPVFDDRWSTMLRERYPIAPYIHMIELLDREDPFDRTNGWNEDKINKLVTDAMVVMSQMNKGSFRSLRCSVNKSACERLIAEGKKALDPFAFCAKGCAALALGWQDTLASRDPVRMCFDRNERFIDRIRVAWESLRAPSGGAKTPGNPWDRFEEVVEDDMKNRPGLQAADMLAWAATRTLSEKERPFSALKSCFQEFVPWTDLPISEGVMRGTEPLPLFNDGRLTLVPRRVRQG